MRRAALCAGLLAVCIGGAAHARVGAEQAAQLDGPTLTCIGAERAGSAGGAAAYTGKFQGSWPGLAKRTGYTPGPYADEKPLYTVTAQNMTQYAEWLTEGQKALLRKYPDAFRMHVYPSHRDFAMPDETCARTKKNATSAELIDEGKGVSGIAGAIPFPFPKNGLEAVWNAANAGRAYSEQATFDIADVYANGSVAWARQKLRTVAHNNASGKEKTYAEPMAAQFYTIFLLPERDRGTAAVGFQPNNYSKAATQAWQYQPGTRRVRQMPEVGFDYAVPPAGFRTSDDDHGYNGSPERYDWKLVGKKEMLVPYANFRINDPALKYKDLIQARTVNPDHLRYERHRVWIIEGTLKSGMRHIYRKRRLYADEDTWLVLTADNYDAREQLWRVPLITYHYAPEAQAWHRGVSIYHDVLSGTYEAGYLVNESKQWWQLNLPIPSSQFTPDAAARAGH